MRKFVSVCLALLVIAFTVTVVSYAEQGITGISYTSDGQIVFDVIANATGYTVNLTKDNYVSQNRDLTADTDGITISNGKVIIGKSLVSDLVTSFTAQVNSIKPGTISDTGISVFELNVFAFNGTKQIAATEGESNFIHYDFDSGMLTDKKPVYEVSVRFISANEDRTAEEYKKIYSVTSSNVTYSSSEPLAVFGEDGETPVDAVTLGNSYWFIMKMDVDDGYYLSGDTNVYVNSTDVTGTLSSFTVDKETGKTVLTIRWYGKITRSKYNLSFFPDATSTMPEQILSDKDGVVKIPDFIPTKEHCEFLGWKKFDDTEVKYLPGDSIILKDDTILFPVWNKIDVRLKGNKKTINYGQILKVEAAAADNFTIHWLIDGKDTKKTGKIFEYDYSLGSHTLTARAEVENGTSVESNTVDLTVTVNDGFFQKLVAFFKYTLFKADRYVTL